MKQKKLTQEEINRALEKIRSEYDKYIVEYMKPSRIKNDFEERYYQALNAKIDLTFFLHAEMSVITEIIKKEEKKKNNRDEKKYKNNSNIQSKENFADKIIAENRKKIEKYADNNFHPEASYEIKKLFGVLLQFEQYDWPEVDRIMKKVSHTYFNGPRLSIERKMYNLCGHAKDGYPARLTTYVSLLSRFPRNYKNMEREEQKCLLEAAFLFHEVVEEIDNIKNNDTLATDEKNYMEKISEYVHTIINDFRLSEFKPR